MTAWAIRLWPPIGLAGMFVLGLAVRKGSTPVDRWFHRYLHTPARFLWYFTDPWFLGVVVAAVVAVALYRRQQRMAVLAVVSPVFAVACVEVAKPLFDRQFLGSLSYPSGHTAATVVVMGFVVLVAGGAVWSVLLAVAVCALGAIGAAVTVHNFTDTVGALLLGTAIVCVASLALGHAPHRT
ncbi:MAG TPA: phosphoesterase PA-phosphatase [Mycobacterium sp.]|nr:phosphoesterase PA-phosphatase [Mycobacterium sp.]